MTDTSATTGERPAIPETMTAVVLTGHGGPDKLSYRTDVPVPTPGAGEVLVRVRACGLNNTDINTRVGWYALDEDDGGGWGGAIRFPRIQGADACGVVAAAGPGVDLDGPDGLGGRRVLIDPWFLDPIPDPGPDSTLPGRRPGEPDRDTARFFGSEVDGGFAQYTVAPVANVHPIDTGLSDAELATFACAAVTAEHLLSRAAVGDGTVVAITGASGGVGTAAVQLAKARGATVIAIAAAAKTEALAQLGADAVVDRDAPDLADAVADASPTGRLDAIADVVGGAMFAELLPVLRRGGHYAASGAIAGALVELDLRILYLNDLTLAGATVCPPGTFARVVAAIEAGDLRPVLAATYPLVELSAAQEAFQAKRHVGNLVVEIP